MFENSRLAAPVASRFPYSPKLRPAAPPGRGGEHHINEQPYAY